MTSPYLTTAEAAEYLGKTPGAFRTFLHRRRRSGWPVRTHRLGRLLKFKSADLDAALSVEETRSTRLRRAV